MDAIAIALSGGVGVLALVAALTRGIAAPIFLWNAAHVVGLTLPFWFYHFGVYVGDPGFVDLNREDGEEIARLATYGSAGVLVTNLIVYLLTLCFPAQHTRQQVIRGREAYGKTMVAVLIWLACVAIGVLLVGRAFGSLASGFSLLSTKVYTPLAGQTYILLPFILAQLVVIVLGVEIATEQHVPTRKLQIVGILTAITMIIMLAIGSRSKSLQTILIPALAYMTQRPLGSKLVLSIVAACFIPYVSWIGLELRSGDPGIARQEFDMVDAMAGLSSSYAILDQLFLVEKYSDTHGPQPFRLFLDYGSLFVPRAIWPEKPLSPHMELRWFLYGDTLGGITPGFYGEFYYYFGPAGFLLGAIVAGVALWTLGQRMKRSVREGRSDVLVFFWTFVIAVQAPRDSMFVVAFSLVVGTLFIKALQFGRSMRSNSLAPSSSSGRARR